MCGRACHCIHLAHLHEWDFSIPPLPYSVTRRNAKMVCKPVTHVCLFQSEYCANTGCSNLENPENCMENFQTPDFVREKFCCFDGKCESDSDCQLDSHLDLGPCVDEYRRWYIDHLGKGLGKCKYI